MSSYRIKCMRPGNFFLNSNAAKISAVMSLQTVYGSLQVLCLHQSIDDLEFITPLGSRTKTTTLSVSLSSESVKSFSVSATRIRTVLMTRIGNIGHVLK